MSPGKKIAIIVQRYGAEVNGGAEMHARMIAQKLALFYDVTVLTSCALDYDTWKPVFPEIELDDGIVHVKRFHNSARNTQLQEYSYKKIKKSPFVYLRYKLFKWLGYWIPFRSNTNWTDQNNMLWLEAQGPAMPELLNYISTQKNNYDAFIFFTTLYYPTALGIMQVQEKSILVPTMHNETASFFPVYQKVMSCANWIMYNTESERRFSEKIFPVKNTKNVIAAVGIDVPLFEPDNSILSKFNIQQPYVIYVGRIDKSKGCDEMIRYFLKYIQHTQSELLLVLVGKSSMPLPAHSAVISTGFISDDEKTKLMLMARALIIPSKFESLSLVLLESFACKVPVIANGKTDVLKDHINKSKGGWCYTSYREFKASLNALSDNEKKLDQKRQNGFEYVTSNYSWIAVIKKYLHAINNLKTD